MQPQRCWQGTHQEVHALAFQDARGGIEGPDKLKRPNIVCVVPSDVDVQIQQEGEMTTMPPPPSRDKAEDMLLSSILVIADRRRAVINNNISIRSALVKMLFVTIVKSVPTNATLVNWGGFLLTKR